MSWLKLDRNSSSSLLEAKEEPVIEQQKDRRIRIMKQLCWVLEILKSSSVITLKLFREDKNIDREVTMVLVIF